EQLGVPPTILRRHGAASHQTARAMAEGVSRRFGSVLGVGVTGVAGPGGSESRRAGLVHVVVAGPELALGRRLSRDLGRHLNRSRAVETALELLLEALGGTYGAWPELFEGL
ncbi:MAG: CinA family protein, partial [Candidatus Dormibacteria bacterium]